MDEKYRKMLEPLINEYQRDLPKFVNEIEALWLQSQNDNMKFDEFCKKIHNMKGASGMLGFNEISNITANIQVIIKQRGNQNGLTHHEVATINELMSELKANIKKL